ncbi:MAG TPA: GIY-YIG nuclease family protein [Methanocorpusculum sp.]|nr:GIY-YIG nuclease family protein [Methanocorpusculum sp.]HJJ90375.1 GIY-YIG nuclease family protein [Methanocorpusculum sp.]
MDKGIYCLLLECLISQRIKIGSLGERDFFPGWYLYVGSALGNGGLSRVGRHIRFYHKQYRSPKWHIDYFMEAPSVRLRKVVCARTESDLECALAEIIGGVGVPAFGCSDCDCATHLFYRCDMPDSEVLAAFTKIGLFGVVHDVDRL